jgi:iron(III) transport system ATP-binding protein
MSAVSITGLVKRHGTVTAVGGIDLDVSEGELVVLLGPSGCGKTSTLRCIAGLEETSEGTISIGGKVVSSKNVNLPPEKRSIGMVFQSYALWPHLTVKQNLAFGLRLRKLPRAQIEERVRAALELVGLDKFGDRSAGELSGGQQQRVALARATVLEPDILLFDEPLSNLDAKMRERMRVEIRNLQRRLGITSIYVTHDQQEAMVIADRIVLMNVGKIEQIGSPAEVYRRPRTRFAANFIGSTNVFPGVVVDNEGSAVVRVGEGSLLHSADNGFAMGAGVDVLVRPEYLRVSKTPVAGANVMEGRISDVIFLGNLGEVLVQVGDATWRVQLSPAGDLAVGDTVWLSVDEHEVVLLNKQV